MLLELDALCSAVNNSASSFRARERERGEEEEEEEVKLVCCSPFTKNGKQIIV